MNAIQVEKETDPELISKILNGETDDYAQIVRKYNAYLYKIGRSYGYNHADTEDLMQDTYINVYLNLKNFEYRSSFKTWLTRIMLHNCYHKKHRLRNLKERDFADFTTDEKSRPLFTNNHDDTNNRVNNDELNQFLEEAILRIPEDYRMVFTLRELNGLNVKETAETLNLTESNVKVRFHRAKDLLKKELLKNYRPEEIFEFNLIYCEPLVERVMEAVKKIKG